MSQVSLRFEVLKRELHPVRKWLAPQNAVVSTESRAVAVGVLASSVRSQVERDVDLGWLGHGHRIHLRPRMIDAPPLTMWSTQRQRNRSIPPEHNAPEEPSDLVNPSR